MEAQKGNIKVPEVVVGRVKKKKRVYLPMCREGGAMNSKQGGDDILRYSLMTEQGAWGGEDEGAEGVGFDLVCASVLTLLLLLLLLLHLHHHHIIIQAVPQTCYADFSHPSCVKQHD